MKRPLSITIIGGFFIGLGTFVVLANVFWLAHGQGLVHGHTESTAGSSSSEYGDEIWVFATQLAAIVAGVFLLRGRNWARWLLVAWLGFHVVLSVFHEWHELVVHGVLTAVLVYFLFRAPASEFFRGGAESQTGRQGEGETRSN